MYRTPIIAVCLALLAGCGGGDSDEQQIRNQTVGYIENLRDGNIASACERTVDPGDCVATFRAAELIAGGKRELLVAADINDETVEKAKDAAIKVDGDTATIEGTKQDMQVELVDGEWKLVLPDMP